MLWHDGPQTSVSDKMVLIGNRFGGTFPSSMWNALHWSVVPSDQNSLVCLHCRCMTSLSVERAAAGTCLPQWEQTARSACLTSATSNTALSSTKTPSTTHCSGSAGTSRTPTTWPPWRWAAWRLVLLPLWIHAIKLSCIMFCFFYVYVTEMVQCKNPRFVWAFWNWEGKIMFYQFLFIMSRSLPFFYLLPVNICTLPSSCPQVVILDVRVPCTPVARLNNHRACVNGIAWAPHSSCHICTAGMQVLLKYSPRFVCRLRAFLSKYISCCRMSGEHHLNEAWTSLQ